MPEEAHRAPWTAELAPSSSSSTMSEPLAIYEMLQALRNSYGTKCLCVRCPLALRAAVLTAFLFLLQRCRPTYPLRLFYDPLRTSGIGTVRMDRLLRREHLLPPRSCAHHSRQEGQADDSRLLRPGGSTGEHSGLSQ
jgi:hypothetical protein